MNPMDLTVDRVRQELTELIGTYPNRTGSIVISDEDEEDNDIDPEYSCVYYTDEDGRPVNVSVFDTYVPELKTPVCIIGQWIESFHPEFKEDEFIHTLLVRNRTIGVVKNDNSAPFTAEVMDVLSSTQSQQDEAGTRWKDIKLLIVN